MTKQTIKILQETIFIVSLLLLAFIFHRAGRGTNDILDKFTNFLRTFLYIGLYTVWLFSLRRRVVQLHARTLLMLIASLMSFWLVLREIRFSFIHSAALLRVLWYAYYVPMLLIPLLALYTALYSGMDEQYRLPAYALIPSAPALILILIVLTNDLHQLVFVFPSDRGEWSEASYNYGPVYYFIVVYFALCVLIGLFIMIYKSRLLGRFGQMGLPAIPMLAAVVYFILYARGISPVRSIGWDLTSTGCLFYAAFLESCLRIGLIQTNTRYFELFAATEDLSAAITDNDYDIRFRAADAGTLPLDKLRLAEKKPLRMEDGRVLHNKRIAGGHAVWTEDISELISVHDRLRSLQEELLERGELLRYEYERESELKRTEEQSRLYDLLQQQTQPQLDRINELVQEYESAADENRRRRILGTILVLGCYVKRRKDLTLTKEKGDSISPDMLLSAMKESLHSMDHLGVQGSCMVQMPEDGCSFDALLCYELFEALLEISINRASWFSARVCHVCGQVRLSVDTDAVFSSEDVSAITDRYPMLRYLVDEDGSMWITGIPEGGENK